MLASDYLRSAMLIKKYVVVMALIPCLIYANDENSKTFFRVEPHFKKGTPEYETTFRDIFILDTERKGAVQLVPYASHSMNSKKLARYFLPFNKSELLVAEDGAQLASVRDVNAVHLNINHDPTTTGDTFQSRSKFFFHQTVIGIGFAVKQRFCPAYDKGLWISASLPFEIVSNKVVIKEHIDNPGVELEPTRVNSVTEAFNQSAWKFGKIDGRTHNKAGVADVEVHLGYEWGRDEQCHADAYVGAVVPAGNKPKACFVFEPVLGNGKHGGILFGASCTKQLCVMRDGVTALTIDTNARYLFSNRQRRSFDLKDKQWGRYMEVYNNKEEAEAALAASSVFAGDHGSPGINVFTQMMKVTPGFSNNLNIAVINTNNEWHLEAGYNLLARQAEKVKLACCWEVGPALVSAVQGGSTTKSRTINRNAAGSDDVDLPSYDPIVESDLDLTSAAHPAVVNHIIYASIGYHTLPDVDSIPFLSLGGSYEFSSCNTSLDRWTAWGKLGLYY